MHNCKVCYDKFKHINVQLLKSYGELQSISNDLIMDTDTFFLPPRTSALPQNLRDLNKPALPLKQLGVPVEEIAPAFVQVIWREAATVFL